MPQAQNSTDEQERIAIQTTWAQRFFNMKHASGLKQSAFCDKYDLWQPVLSKLINFGATPSWDMIKRIEKGLKKEGF